MKTTMQTLLKLAMRHLARLHPQTDLLIRISYLEGAAGVSPGTWMRKGRKGLSLAVEHLPGLHGSWTRPGNSGVLDAVLAGAAQVLKGGVRDLDADSLVQSLLIGISPLTGEKLKPLYWGLGVGHADDVQGGSFRTTDFQALARQATKRRAISTIRHAPKPAVSTQDESGATRVDLERGEASDALSLALRDKGDPRARLIRDRLKELAMRAAQSPSKEATALTYVAYLDLLETASDERGVAAQLARQLEVPKGTISKRLSFMHKFMLEVGRRDGKLKKMIAEVLALGELGFAQRAAAQKGCGLDPSETPKGEVLTLAKHLASRHLSRS